MTTAQQQGEDRRVKRLGCLMIHKPAQESVLAWARAQNWSAILGCEVRVEELHHELGPLVEFGFWEDR